MDFPGLFSTEIHVRDTGYLRKIMEFKTSFHRIVILILILLVWCHLGLAVEGKQEYWPTQGWRTASPESQGMDSEILLKMMDGFCPLVHCHRPLKQRKDDFHKPLQ